MATALGQPGPLLDKYSWPLPSALCVKARP